MTLTITYIFSIGPVQDVFFNYTIGLILLVQIIFRTKPPLPEKWHLALLGSIRFRGLLPLCGRLKAVKGSMIPPKFNLKYISNGFLTPFICIQRHFNYYLLVVESSKTLLDSTIFRAPASILSGRPKTVEGSMIPPKFILTYMSSGLLILFTCTQRHFKYQILAVGRSKFLLGSILLQGPRLSFMGYAENGERINDTTKNHLKIYEQWPLVFIYVHLEAL